MAGAPITSGGRRQVPLGDWQLRAACAGLPGVLEGPETAAKELCASCPVIRDCTRWVLPLKSWEEPDGVVAGMTAKDRKRARGRRRGQLAAAAKRRNAAARAEVTA